MPDGAKLAEFTAWCGNNIAGDEKGEAQIFLNRFVQVFSCADGLDGMPAFD